MTINEYKSQRNLTNTEMAEIVDVSVGTIRNLLNGAPASKRVASKLAELGIECEVYKCEGRGRGAYKTRTARPHKRRKKEEEILDSFLKPYQLNTVKNYGNTIVSKKYSVEAIIKEFKRFGLNVSVENFTSREVIGENTYLVIRKGDVNEISDKRFHHMRVSDHE